MNVGLKGRDQPGTFLCEAWWLGEREKLLQGRNPKMRILPRPMSLPGILPVFLLLEPNFLFPDSRADSMDGRRGKEMTC